ncbi:MAG: sel1 repeat family protein [Magnetococcales bacterium]|nr:sel1 repeat family protein [Magnetococcales bacterium]
MASVSDKTIRMFRVSLICLYGLGSLACDDLPSLIESARQGDVNAQLELGLMHFNTLENVPENAVKAADWFRKAAEKGNPVAQFYLATLYRDGLGVPQSDLEKVKWLSRASEQGDFHAQYALARSYLNGDGVQRDLLLAHQWMSLSASRCMDDVDNRELCNHASAERDEIASELTPHQIIELQKSVKQWHPTKESATE